MYARLQNFIQLCPTLTKLCHFKRDYLVHVICANCPKRTKTCAFQRRPYHEAHKVSKKWVSFPLSWHYL